jgi:hypothetical protein
MLLGVGVGVDGILGLLGVGSWGVGDARIQVASSAPAIERANVFMTGDDATLINLYNMQLDEMLINCHERLSLI